MSGRQLAQNPIDFDSAARSLGHAGAVANIPVLAFWDLAAFPSVAHRWLFKVLVHTALPRGLLEIIRGMYFMTGAYGVGEEGLRFLFWILSGVIQGCPFSGMLFVFALGPFLHAIEVLLDSPGISTTRACADDIGAAISSLQHMRVFHSLFKVLRWASNLRLSPPKCVIVPVAVGFSQEVRDQIRDWLALHIPEWSGFEVCPSGKYLGFLLGPAVDLQSWNGPLSKWSYRVDLISRAGAAPSIGARLYNGRALPVLGYVAQLVPAPSGFLTMEMRAANKVWHTPGSTLSASLACSLGELGLVPFRSASALCAASLARAACSGKLEWSSRWDDMMGAALTNLPFVRVVQELPWGVHWRGRAFADNLRLAALGDQRVAPNRAASRAVEGVARAVQGALAGAEDGKAPELQAVGCATYLEARFSVDVSRLIRARLGALLLLRRATAKLSSSIVILPVFMFSTYS